MIQRLCKKCMIPDFVDDKDRFVSTYLNQILPEDRIEDETYDCRLETCRKCDFFLNGICRLCGCFVVLRAAVKGQYCPSHTDKWQREEL